jgi:hypothetical protein
MPLTSNVGDVPSSQPKVQVTTKTWDLRISSIVTRNEVQIILEDNSPILKQPYMLGEIERALV